MADTKNYARWIRAFRWLHRKIAVPTLAFFLIISLTGLLLGIKKQTGLLAPTQKGVSPNLSAWLSIDSLHKIAIIALRDSIDHKLSATIERIDIRPDKGVVKFSFTDHYWGLQLDGATGRVVSIEKRTSDLIENIHDGSILDKIFGTNEKFKVGYTVISGLSLLALVISGYWLWFGPRRIRALKRKEH